MQIFEAEGETKISESVMLAKIESSHFNLLAFCEKFFRDGKMVTDFLSILCDKSQHFAKIRVKSAWNLMTFSVIFSVKFNSY